MFYDILEFFKHKGITQPEIGIILGSGLGDLAEEITDAVVIPYEEIPNFPVSTVEGHEGKLVYGHLVGKRVIALKGRFHYYEGYDLSDVTFPVRLFKELGVKQLILTNAAGGVNPSFFPGDIMVITDHINLTGNNPLIGPNHKQGPRFVDLTHTYSERGIRILKAIAQKHDLVLREGVYTWMTGPSYETPAEIRMVGILGGDAVGMSTVPEAIVAKHVGLEVIGLSCITNLAAGMQEKVSHEEVMAISKQSKPYFKLLIRELISRL